MITDSTERKTRPRTRPTPDHGISSVVHHGVTAALVAAFLGLGIWLVLKDDPPIPTEELRSDLLVDAREVRREHRVRRAMGVYPLRFGSDVDKLESLLRKGLLVPRDLYYGQRAPRFRLSSGDDGPTLGRTDSNSPQP